MSEPGTPRPRDKRLSRIVRATLVTATGERHDVLVRNISRHGLGGKVMGAALRRGDPVTISLPLIGNVAGIICWVRENGFGLESRAEIATEKILFHDETGALNAKPESHSVAERFRPVTDHRRPGFGRKKDG